MAQEQFTSEEWLPVVGWEGFYEVSSAGRVKRVKRGNRTFPGRILVPFTSNGYRSVHLCKNGEPAVRASVHRLVCRAFHGLPPEGKPHVNHINGKPGSDSANNLEWVSPAENVRHAIATGLMIPCSGHTEDAKARMSQIHKRRCAERPERMARGELHGMSKLTDQIVKQILSAMADNPAPTISSVARRFGVDRNVIYGIRDNKAWKHVPRS